MIFLIKNFTESNNVQNIKSKWSVHCQGFCIQGAWGSAPPPPSWETPLPARGATIPTPIASQGHCLPPYPRRRDYRRDCIWNGVPKLPRGRGWWRGSEPRKYHAGVADGGSRNYHDSGLTKRQNLVLATRAGELPKAGPRPTPCQRWPLLSRIYNRWHWSW